MRYDKDETRDEKRVAEILGEAFQEEVPDSLDSRLSATLSAFSEDLENHPYVRRLERRAGRVGWFGVPAWGRPLGWAILSALCLVVPVLFFLGNETPTWAQVAERFRSVEAYSATIYTRKDAFATPEQFEIWANAKGEARLKSGTELIFAKNGKILKAFDLETREAIEAIEPRFGTLMFLSKLDPTGGFSLDTLMHEMAGDWSDSTPKLNADAMISEDLVVFDVNELGGKNWARIWALRESKLPVHLRCWEPHDGECVDIFFTYSNDQPREFYDPDAFASKLKDHSVNQARLAYALMEDPGAQRIGSGAVDVERAFSVVAHTFDGVPWRLEDHRGKVVLLGFWNTTYGYDDLDWWREIHQEYGQREDFMMVGVVTEGDRESALSYCRDQGIDWIQLYQPHNEGEPTLAEAFGDRVDRTKWLVWKDGRVDRLDHPGEQVQAALEGLSYETHSWITPVLSRRIGRGEAMSREEVRDLCGEPHEITTQEGQVTWMYNLPSQDGKAEYKVTLTFDSTGKNLNISSQRRLLNGGIGRIYIGAEFWREVVSPQIDPDLLPAQNHRFGIALSARSGNREVFFSAGHPWPEFEPGKEYVRQMEPGTYDLFVVVCDKRTFQPAQTIPLNKSILIASGETAEVRFE